RPAPPAPAGQRQACAAKSRLVWGFVFLEPTRRERSTGDAVRPSSRIRRRRHERNDAAPPTVHSTIAFVHLPGDLRGDGARARLLSVPCGHAVSFEGVGQELVELAPELRHGGMLLHAFPLTLTRAILCSNSITLSGSSVIATGLRSSSSNASYVASSSAFSSASRFQTSRSALMTVTPVRAS